MAEKFIQNAIKHPGAFTAKAKAAGESVGEYAEEKKHAKGATGRQARLAQTLRKLGRKRSRSKSRGSSRK